MPEANWAGLPLPKLIQVLLAQADAPARLLLEWEQWVHYLQKNPVPGMAFVQVQKELRSYLLQVAREQNWKDLAAEPSVRALLAAMSRIGNIPREKALVNLNRIAGDLPVGTREAIARMQAFAPVVAPSGSDRPELVSLFAKVGEMLSGEDGSIDHFTYGQAARDLLVQGLEASPQRMREWFRGITLSARTRRLIQEAMPLDSFLAQIYADHRGQERPWVEGILDWITILHPITDQAWMRRILQATWEAVFMLLESGKLSPTRFRKLIDDSLELYRDSPGASTQAIAQEIRRRNRELPPALREVLPFQITQRTAASGRAAEVQATSPVDGLSVERIEQLIGELIRKGQAPDWLKDARSPTARQLLAELVAGHPAAFIRVLRFGQHDGARQDWLLAHLPFSDLVRGMAKLHPGMHAPLRDLEATYQALAGLPATRIPVTKMQEMMRALALNAWRGKHWATIAPGKIWQEFHWELCIKGNLSEADFRETINALLFLFPQAYQLSFRHLFRQKNTNRQLHKKQSPIEYEEPNLGEGITIFNAGLVLLNNYIPMLLERLSAVRDKAFVIRERQLEAVHYLQFLATGLSETEKVELPLNKLLCGLRLSDAVPESAEISTSASEMMEGLIEAMISHWTAIGSTSVEGFRGNWLVREGMLVEKSDRWELIVEKRPYDLLIERAPFSFSIIKYPWMTKPIHVTWPF